MGRFTGDVLTAAQLNQDIRDNVNIIAAVGITAWSAYTPTWTSTGTACALGSGGYQTGYYCQLGKVVVASASIGLGTTPTVGTGDYRWAIPVTADAQAYDGNFLRPQGTFWYRDFSVRIYKCWAIFATTAVVTGYIDATNASVLGATLPVVPATSDSYNHLLIYETA